MSVIRQWIEENNFGNVFSCRRIATYDFLCYGDFHILSQRADIKNCTYLLTMSVNRILGYNKTRYATIEESLLFLDKQGLFRNDLKWKMIISIIKERMI